MSAGTCTVCHTPLATARLVEGDVCPNPLCDRNASEVELEARRLLAERAAEERRVQSLRNASLRGGQ